MLSLVLSLAVAMVITLCAVVALQLRSDRPVRPEPRHRTTTVRPISAPPAPEPVAAAPFDPLDERTTLDEVERFLASLLADDDTREFEAVQ